MRAPRYLAVLAIVVAACTESTGPNLSSVPGYLISSVRISPSVDTLFVPDTIRAADRITFTAFAVGKNGGVLPVALFAWSTSDPSIATVDDQGVVTPRTTGTVEVMASADKIGRATLVILPATMSVSLAPAVDTIFVGQSIVPDRDTIRLEPTARDLAGALLGGVTFEWASSSPLVATVDATGLVRAVGLGTTNITVSANGHHASSLVHVIGTGSH